MANRETLRTFFISCAFLGLIAWNAVLQSRYDVKFREYEKMIRSVDEANSKRIKRSLNNQLFGGATYIRWGRTVCPGDADLVYTGFAGGEGHGNQGGASQYICLSGNPNYARYTAAADATAWVSGVEFELPGSTSSLFDNTNAQPSVLQDSDVKCVVCRSRTKTSMVMIPGTKECTDGWNKEYWGYLMSGHYGHKGRTSYACVDNAPEAGTDGGAKNEGGALMYHVQGWCSSLPCTPYVHGYELPCVVCTK